MITRRLAPFLSVVLLSVLNTPLKAQTGDLKVTVSTTGMSPEVGRYVVALDLESRAIGVNDSVVFAEVLEGSHTVTLLDVPESCTVRRSNPREAVVAADEVAAVRFAVTCALLGAQGRQRVREETAAIPPVEREAQRVEEAPAVAEEFASEAISGYWDGQLSFPAGFPGKVIARLPVPAGSYVIAAKMEIYSHSVADGLVGCRLIAGTHSDEARTAWAEPLDHYGWAFVPRAIALNVVHTFTLPGKVLLQCWYDPNRADQAHWGAYVMHTKITAIRVSKLTNKPLERVE
jgi:hypothetical protein